MPRILRRPLALQDLDQIWDYIAQDNPKAADDFIDRIEGKCRLLAEHPKIGTSCEALHPSLRFLAVGKYLIFYLPLDDGVEIVRVLHGARDLESLF
ncbi:MAG: type II toxin-antitoxin system RelE/ParE family toxin [Nitrospirales bacterium]|nr:type II toxin-antitoxin system RelE/ParE family toxin [Nitrospirales bacterium]